MFQRCAEVLLEHLEKLADPLRLELQNWTVCAFFQEDGNTSVGSRKCLR